MANNQNLSNPGVRAGAIWVSDPKEQVKYYAVGADFDGEPDRWNVEGAIAELIPREAPSVVDPAAHKQLPPA